MSKDFRLEELDSVANIGTKMVADFGIKNCLLFFPSFDRVSSGFSNAD